MKAISKVAKDTLELPPARMLMDSPEKTGAFSPQVEAIWDEEVFRRMQSVRDGTARFRSFDQVFAGLGRGFQICN